MGRGIAVALVNGGLRVRLFDSHPPTLDAAMAAFPGFYRSALAKGRLSAEEVEARLDAIVPARHLEELAESDVVIEAIIEDLGAKLSLLTRLDRVVRPDTVLATNTSTLDVETLSGATTSPSRFLGMHFFSPANVMRLLEIVRHPGTSEAALAIARDVGLRSGKTPVVVGNGPSFVANRMLHRRLWEAVLLVEEGADVQDVDRVMTDFGFPLGPFAISDLAGVDVGWRAREQQRRDGSPLAMSRSWLDLVAERGRHGQKTGVGVYRYPDGGRSPMADPGIRALVDEATGRPTARADPIPDEEILDRCLLMIANEGARILEEGVAADAADIDTIWRLGFGFPADHGGPMAWADSRGSDVVRDGCARFHAVSGRAEWKPAAFLERLADRGGRFLDEQE